MSNRQRGCWETKRSDGPDWRGQLAADVPPNEAPGSGKLFSLADKLPCHAISLFGRFILFPTASRSLIEARYDDRMKSHPVVYNYKASVKTERGEHVTTGNRTRVVRLAVTNANHYTKRSHDHLACVVVSVGDRQADNSGSIPGCDLLAPFGFYSGSHAGPVSTGTEDKCGSSRDVGLHRSTVPGRGYPGVIGWGPRLSGWHCLCLPGGPVPTVRPSQSLFRSRRGNTALGKPIQNYLNNKIQYLVNISDKQLDEPNQGSPSLDPRCKAGKSVHGASVHSFSFPDK
ncbi:hypothetical protein Bbelb_216470 [Branchiostoma belcheri]|nr:hypothetical protein Bbelb_216470 [Branchiostoma belcheri]